MIRLGSLFDGIGGFPLAATMHGIEPVWASEIEKFPIEVTKARFPNMKHLGDITQINGAEIEPVDIITFGSPCQDLSVAGKRAGLEGKRSNLFHRAVEIIREMREATNGVYPRFAIWENVPGAFSSNGGQDFRAVLEEIAESEIPMPASGRWATAGMVRGDGRSLAWRVLDAQYWGVPQRRKRIFLVADFAGQRAGEILFERSGLSGHITESGKAREEGAAGAGDGTTTASGDIVLNDQGGSSISTSNNISPTLRAEAHGNLPCVLQKDGNVTGFRMTAFGEYADDNTAGTIKKRDHKDATDLVAYSLQGNMIGRQDKNGPQGSGINEDVSFTLNATDKHAVVYPINTQIATRHNALGERTGLGIGANGDPAYTLQANHSHAVAQLYENHGFGQYQEGVGTLRSNGGDCGGGSENLVNQNHTVRHLTVIECLRLQGFPDWWFDGVPGYSDTQGYKAVGSSIAVPCVDWIMGRMALAKLSKEASQWTGSTAIKKKDKRLAAILALAYIVLIFVMYMHSPKQAAYSASRYVRYTVQGGDTLWSIAKTRSGNRDIRAVVWELQEVNGITPVIRPGQVIWVPEVGQR